MACWHVCTLFAQAYLEQKQQTEALCMVRTMQQLPPHELSPIDTAVEGHILW